MDAIENSINTITLHLIEEIGSYETPTSGIIIDITSSQSNICNLRVINLYAPAAILQLTIHVKLTLQTNRKDWGL